MTMNRYCSFCSRQMDVDGSNEAHIDEMLSFLEIADGGAGAVKISTVLLIDSKLFVLSILSIVVSLPRY